MKTLVVTSIKLSLSCRGSIGTLDKSRKSHTIYIAVFIYSYFEKNLYLYLVLLILSVNK